jgi:molybdopterin molybdotransferase
MELLKVMTINEMKELIHREFSHVKLKKERIGIEDALDRILATDVISTMDVPHFNRSVVDGYAVKLTDIQGASASVPGFLKIIGEVEMGAETTLVLRQGETAYVPTGGMVPEGTEAVVMIEYAEKLGERDLAIYQNVGAYENMMRIGDDIAIGETVLSKGHFIRPQDIGVLSALGHLEIEVYKPLEITIISTGDEIIPPGQMPKPGQVIDINTPALKAVARRFGTRIVSSTYARDDFEILKETVEDGLKVSDMVVLSGGSSMGEKDYTAKVIDLIGKVLLHGLSVKPGKPTILGKVDNKPVLGLPGQPAAAIMVFMVLLREFLQLYYQQDYFRVQMVKGVLTENIHAAPGRRSFQTVKIKKNNAAYDVTPTHGKSGMITLLSFSDGYIEITENEEGKNAGDLVEVMLF